MIGRAISHYRLVSHLGSGGMGVVYAAEDLRLGRTVALKFVPDDLAEDPQAVHRLRAEARAASALNHPNICTIHDIGEDEGRPFIVMELMKGQTLRDKLASGPLRIPEIVDIGIQIADALDAAHGCGIIHRDIKPANLFLTERKQVKILDFGLAKLLPAQASGETTAQTSPDHLTVDGATIGTVAYMSPEQVSGEQLDGRTDLFSLGIVLYECVTGHRPFAGKTAAVIFSAILNRSPVAPILYKPDVPLRFQDVITNCLEKDRELRYQDAAGLRADLKRVRRDLESSHASVRSDLASVSGGANDEVTLVDVGRGSVPRAGATQLSKDSLVPSTSPSIGTRPRRVALTVALLVVIGGLAAGAYLKWPRAAVHSPGVSRGAGPGRGSAPNGSRSYRGHSNPGQRARDGGPVRRRDRRGRPAACCWRRGRCNRSAGNGTHHRSDCPGRCRAFRAAGRSVQKPIGYGAAKRRIVTRSLAVGGRDRPAAAGPPGPSGPTSRPRRRASCGALTRAAVGCTSRKPRRERNEISGRKLLGPDTDISRPDARHLIAVWGIVVLSKNHNPGRSCDSRTHLHATTRYPAYATSTAACAPGCPRTKPVSLQSCGLMQFRHDKRGGLHGQQ